MRKVYALLLLMLLVFTFALCGCTPVVNIRPSTTAPIQTEHVFNAIILEVRADTLLVTPLINTGYVPDDVPDEIEIPIVGMSESMSPTVGDLVAITYIGSTSVVETYPSQIDAVVKIERADDRPSVPPLSELSRYDSEYLTVLLAGFTEEQLIEAWGHWDGCLSGLRGDIWIVDKDDPDSKKILVYYKQNAGQLPATEVNGLRTV